MDQLLSCDCSHNSNICTAGHSPALVWRNVRCTLPTRLPSCVASDQVVLRQLNGHFEVNTLNAVMSPRAQIRSTVLHCLSGCQLGLCQSQSEVYFYNPERLSPAAQLYFIARHTDQSVASDQLTVGELFRYAYRFKNGCINSSACLMEQYIARVASDMLLDRSVLDRVFRHCTPGERKRVAIGQELVSLRKPRLLFLDQPTTGLNNAAAFKVLKCVRALTRNYQMTVVATTVSPCPDMIRLFDKLYVVAKDGVCIFAGPPSLVEHTLSTQLQLSFASTKHPHNQVELSPNASACTASDSSPIATLMWIARQHLQHHSVVLLSECFSALEFSRTSQLLNGDLFSTVHCTRKCFRATDLACHLCRHLRSAFGVAANRRKLLLLLTLYVGVFALVAVMTGLGESNPSVKGKRTSLNRCLLPPSTNATIEQVVNFKGTLNYTSFAIIAVGWTALITSTIWFGARVTAFQSEHRNNWYSFGTFYWSTVVVTTAEVILFGTVIGLLSYFALPFAPTPSSFDWSRWALLTLFLAQLYLYRQTVGQLLGALLVTDRSRKQTTVWISLLLVVSEVSFNFLISDETPPAKDYSLFRLTNLVSLKYVTYGVLYAIFGHDLSRCDHSTLQYWNLDHSSDHLMWPQLCLKILAYVLAVKLLTVVFLCWRFGCCCCRRATSCFKGYSQSSRLIPIDFTGVVTHL